MKIRTNSEGRLTVRQPLRGPEGPDGREGGIAFSVTAAEALRVLAPADRRSPGR